MNFTEDVFLCSNINTEQPRVQRQAIFIIFFILLATVSSVRSQPSVPTKLAKPVTTYKDTTIVEKSVIKHPPLGIFVGGAISLHSFKDGALPTTLANLCDTFLSGSGSQPFFQIGVDLPFGESKFHLRPSIFYEGLGAEHTYGEFAPATDTTGGVQKDRTIQFDHTITSATKSIGISALLNWSPIPYFSIGIAPSLSYLFDQQYTKVVKVITPGDILIDNGKPVREKIESSGAIPEVHSILPAIAIRIGGDLPLSARLRAEPSLSFNLPLSGVTSYWTHNTVRAGIDFRYELAPKEDTIFTTRIEKIPTTIFVVDTPKDHFNAHVDVIAGDILYGNEQRVARMEVRQITARTAYPMLNYIFFDSARSVIPTRYIQYSSLDEASKLFKGSIERRGERIADLYLETLNILGERLRRFPTATIKLIGSVANVGIEENRNDIALARAQAVKSYLHDVWKIEQNRISVSGVLTPNKPSPNSIIQGQAENRRVEIITNDNRITDPLYVTNIEHTANPPHITITQSYDGGVMERYHVSIMIAGKEVSGFDGDSSNAPLNNFWTVTEEALSPQTDSLQIELRATSTTGEVALARTAIKLEQRKVEQNEEQKVDRFSLILYGFDESALGDKNERTMGLVTDMLKRIKPKQLNVVGYTDELGDEAHNNILSMKRASEAAQYLQKDMQKKGITISGGIVVSAKGSRERLFDNKLPEGRFLSRTVLISIER